MKSSVWTAILVLSLVFVCLACGGSGSSPTSPPVPPTPSGKQFQFNVIASSAILEGALLEATISFDGREVSRVDWSRGGSSCLVLCGLAGDVQGITTGNHTITFTVVRQTRTTVDYFVACGGVLTDPATGARDQVNTQQQRAQLRAGQSVTFTVRL